LVFTFLFEDCLEQQAASALAEVLALPKKLLLPAGILLIFRY
jgi:hypothetical protein